MAVTFKFKRKVNSASDKNPPHGKNSSNKVINIGIDTDSIAENYPDHNVLILKPVIDRIVLRYDPTKDWSDKKTQTFENFVYSYINGSKRTKVQNQQ